MLASIVMAFSIATSISTLQRGFRSVDSARNISLAAQIMQSEMERIRLRDWTTVNAYEAGPTTLTVDSVFTSTTSIGTRFALTRTTAAVSGLTDVKEITLTVTWTGIDGRVSTRSYSTYYGRYGLYDYFYNTT